MPVFCFSLKRLCLAFFGLASGSRVCTSPCSRNLNRASQTKRTQTCCDDSAGPSYRQTISNLVASLLRSSSQQYQRHLSTPDRFGTLSRRAVLCFIRSYLLLLSRIVPRMARRRTVVHLAESYASALSRTERSRHEQSMGRFRHFAHVHRRRALCGPERALVQSRMGRVGPC